MNNYQDWGTNLCKERKKKERRKVKGSIRSLIRPLHDRYCSFLGLSLHVVFRLTFETRNGSTPHVPSCWILTTISDVRRIAVKNVVHLPQQKTAVDLTSDSPVFNNRYLLLLWNLWIPFSDWSRPKNLHDTEGSHTSTLPQKRSYTIVQVTFV